MFTQDIGKVTILKRVGVTGHFQSVELRMGTADESGSGLTQLTGNALVGTFGDQTADVEHSFLIEPVASGQYLTLQTTAVVFLSFDEIYVFQMI